jgi:hypothetical protein
MPLYIYQLHPKPVQLSASNYQLYLSKNHPHTISMSMYFLYNHLYFFRRHLFPGKIHAPIVRMSMYFFARQMVFAGVGAHIGSMSMDFGKKQMPAEKIHISIAGNHAHTYAVRMSFEEIQVAIAPNYINLAHKTPHISSVSPILSCKMLVNTLNFLPSCCAQHNDCDFLTV